MGPIYDNETFFAEYRTLRRRDDCLNDLLEQPAIKKLLPDLRGKAVLDLGCGFGANCLDFAHRGAERVVGLDVSEKMLRAAQAESSAPQIEYLHMDMSDISRINESFDLIYSSLAFHYIENFSQLSRDIFPLLKRGGRLLFSQEHPIVTATIGGQGHFNRDENGNRVSYTFSNYSQSGRRESFWFVDGVVKYHRSMGEIITALAEAGLVIEKVEEPRPESWALEKLPSLSKELLKPTFLIVRARKV